MTTDTGDQAVIPAWVSPPHRQIVELHHFAYALAEQVDTAAARGQLAAVEWVTGGEPTAPITGRDEPVTRDLVRAEAWVAAIVAAEAPPVIATEWHWFADAYPLPARTTDPDYGYAVWTTLAWMAGVRTDPPATLPARDPDGRLVEPIYATRPDPSSPMWRAADARRRNHAREDAQAYVSRVRAWLRGRRPPT